MRTVISLFTPHYALPLFIAVGSAISPLTAPACSDVVSNGIEDRTTWVVSGRNLDMTSDLSGDFLFDSPAGSEFQAKDSSGGNGKRWVSSHRVVAVRIDTPDKTKKAIDGINSAGLSAAALWQRDAVTPAEALGENVIEVSDLVSYLLGTQKTAAECKSAVEGLAIWRAKDGSTLQYPVHIVIHDAEAHSLLVEWLPDGTMSVYGDDELYAGVVTNEPGLVVHSQNLLNYKNLKNEDTDPGNAGGGLLGMPGDQSSMSRFVRLALIRKYALKKVDHWTCFFFRYPGDAAWNVQQTFHLLNRAVGIRGEMTHQENGVAVYPHTVLTVVRDHVNKKLYYRGYNSLGINIISLPSAGETTEESGGWTAVDNMDDNLGDANVPDVSASSISGTYSCPERSDTPLTLTATITIPTADQGKKSKIFVFSRDDKGLIYSWDGKKWSQKKSGGSLVPCWQGKLESMSIPVFKDQDMETHSGMSFYAGYGISDAEMFVKGTYEQIYRQDDNFGDGGALSAAAGTR